MSCDRVHLLRYRVRYAVAPSTNSMKYMPAAKTSARVIQCAGITLRSEWQTCSSDENRLAVDRACEIVFSTVCDTGVGLEKSTSRRRVSACSPATAPRT